ncbi:hypothetical protein ASPWEDRAFT_177164 [Aspergillus wentii DTO 134E9]|uniref:Cytochrome P450 monooxygenase n=1 Tax=Aspergillus wentii DTO 134E9 TaxID=1073089 RepID=A0A1L9R6J4_ASPWE|nr:uncharacterized protein ASPWEDRAFT_177164 [Aspergillus wentii DTO 134E9]KAI9926823.1 hypothetical protein MW887_003919 [Aspergillus wentii]OJJ30508.1 hypothetical protein ASPWEDRAFT_177164 [Aspergillus wentii DTO 134E9]
MEISVHLRAIYIGIAILVFLNPEYRFFGSYIATVIIYSNIATWLKILYNFTLYPRFFTPLKNLPTPLKRTWLKGNTDSILLEAPFANMREWIKSVPNEGLIRYYMVGNLERVLLTSPKALGEVLVHKAYDFEKPSLVRIQLQRAAGLGLLLSEGNDHKHQRKELLPAFSYRHIKDLYPIFWSKSTEMVKVIEEVLGARQHPEDNVIQVSDFASRVTLDIVAVAGMDHDFDSLRNPANELNKQFRRIFAQPSTAMKIIALLGIFVFDLRVVQMLPFKRNRECEEGSRVIRDVARQMVREKKERMENKTTTPKDGVDIISVALKSGSFSEENLVDQMMTFLTAGHETTATALQWAVYALCKHPDVQTRLREEIRSNLPPISTENPDIITATQIDSLPYLNAVCNEVLRFHPSVPITVRIASRDTRIIDKPIPKDSFIVIVPGIINRDKELWGPDADTFNPERWLGQGRANSGGASNNYAFLTFLHGPRSCIGQGFAKGELACLIAATVGRFHMELKDPDAEAQLAIGATVAPKDGVLARFTVLDGW